MNNLVYRSLHLFPFAAAFLSISLTACSNKPADDPVEYSFVVVGGCRMDKSDTNSATNPSGANLAQLERTLQDVTELDPKPGYVFFDGDEVFGYERDTAKLGRMLAAWRDSVEASPCIKAGIKVIAIAGNHETQVDVDSGKGKIAIPEAEMVWLKTMGPLSNGNNGPHAGGPDSLATDQSRLTYSFNYRDAHIVVMNTDPVGQDSHVPVHWISDDIDAARKSGVKHIFAIGHKPAFAYNGSADELVTANGEALWAALERNHAEAMIGSHIHVFWYDQPHASLPGMGKTWMITSGNGGTPLEKNIPPNKHYFGFSVVSVLKSGKVIVKSYGRDVPKEGYAAAAPKEQYPLSVRDSVDITWKD